MLTTVKTCFKCGAERPLTDFYRHSQMADGYLGKCKKCTKEDVKNNYAGRREQYAEYERGRFQSRRPYALAAVIKHRDKYPERYKARTALNNAVRDGRVIKQPCSVCGKKAQAHHTSYDRPLDVEWLCREHHLESHGKIAYKEI